jgi:hypothetical protein
MMRLRGCDGVVKGGVEIERCVFLGLHALVRVVGGGRVVILGDGKFK